MFDVLPKFGTLLATLCIALLTYQSTGIAQRAFETAIEEKEREAQSYIYVANLDVRGDWGLEIHEHNNREFRPLGVKLIPIYRVEGHPHRRGDDIDVPIGQVERREPTTSDELVTYRISNTKRLLCPNYQNNETERAKCEHLVDLRVIITTSYGTKPAILYR